MIVPIALGVIGLGALLLGRPTPKASEEPNYPPMPPSPGPQPSPGPSPYTVPTETQALYMAKLQFMGVPSVLAFQQNWNDGGYTDASAAPYQLQTDGALGPSTMQAIDEAARYFQAKQIPGPQVPIDYKPDSPPSPFQQYQGQENRLRERPIYY